MAEQDDSEPSLLLVAIQQQGQQKQDQHKGTPEHLMYKNRLQEFTQRASIPFPVYDTINEAEPRHPAKYRSTVEVDGEKYTCPNTFSSRKAAEQDASRIALNGISEKIKNCASKKTSEGGFPPVFQDKVFCKSILNEFAAKMNIEKPKYDTVKVEGLFPVFASSLVFNGVKYSGQNGVNKKEAEQLAARAAILSILANPGQGMQLSEIVISKAKLFSAVHEHTSVSDSTPIAGNPYGTSAIGDSVGTTQTSEVIQNIMLEEKRKSKKKKGTTQTSEVIQNIMLEVPQGESPVPPKHEFRKPGLEILTPADPLPIAFVPSLKAQTPLDTSASGEKRKSKKKKGTTQTSEVIQNTMLEVPQGESPVPPKHEFRKPGHVLEILTPADPLPIAFVPSLEAQTPLDTSASGEKRKSKKKKGTTQTSEVIQNIMLEVPQGESPVPPKHEFRKPGLEILTPADPLPIAFVPSLEAQTPLDTSASGEKRKSKKKKGKVNKKAKFDVESQVLPVSQGTSCSVSLSS